MPWHSLSKQQIRIWLTSQPRLSRPSLEEFSSACRLALPSLIADVPRALRSTHAGAVAREPEPLMPAVNPKKSVQPDYIVCLEDGLKFKSLKRHLRTHHEMSPVEYRERWGLPHD